MDLNQLLYHHQIALMQGGSSPAPGANLSDHYARKIRDLRSKLGLGPFAGWTEAGAIS